MQWEVIEIKDGEWKKWANKENDRVNNTVKKGERDFGWKLPKRAKKETILRKIVHDVAITNKNK